MKQKTNQLARAAMTLLLAVLSSTGAWAEDKAPGIIVWLANGDKTEVLFSDMPELTYVDGYVTLQSNNPSTAISWPLETVKKLTFEPIRWQSMTSAASWLSSASSHSLSSPRGRI